MERLNTLMMGYISSSWSSSAVLTHTSPKSSSSSFCCSSWSYVRPARVAVPTLTARERKARLGLNPEQSLSMLLWNPRVNNDQDKTTSSKIIKLDPVTSPQEHLHRMTSASDISILEVTASYCKACQAAQPKLETMAQMYEEHNVVVYQLDFENNKEFCKDVLHLEALPYFVVYARGVGAVDQFACGWEKMNSKLGGAVQKAYQLVNETKA